MLAARKPAKEPSSKWTPTPPLPVIVGPRKHRFGGSKESYAIAAVATDGTAT
jgi:hypothetical protein